MNTAMNTHLGDLSDERTGALALEDFAADRSRRLERNDEDLAPVVREALVLYPEDGWSADIVEAASVLWSEAYDAAGGDPEQEDDALAAWQTQISDNLAMTTQPADPPGADQVDRITYWLSTSAANGGTFAAVQGRPGLEMWWVSMRDRAVRDTHAAADGQTRTPGDTFDIGGYPLHYPGEPVGPPEIWINCRCLLAPASSELGVVMSNLLQTPTPREVFAGRSGHTTTTTMTAAPTASVEAEPEVVNDQDDDDAMAGITDPDELMPWHGILAPEGVATGDGRQFELGALTHRDLPVPIRYTPIDNGAHQGAVIVGYINDVWRDEESNVWGAGVFDDNAYATEAVDLIAKGMLRGVSVDLDDMQVEYAYADDSVDENGDPAGAEMMVVTHGRISAATLVAIPAFAEAYVTLGTRAEGEADARALAAAGCLPCQARADALAEGHVEEFAEQVSDKPWSDFSQADYSDDQWYRATILHRAGDSRTKSDNGLPIREPDGTLNRNGVHAAASRFSSTEGPADAKAAAAAALRGAYDTLGEEPPEAIATAAAEVMGWAKEAWSYADALAGKFAASVDVGDVVSWIEKEDDGQVEEHRGTVVSVDGEGGTAQVIEDDDTYEIPVADLVIEQAADAASAQVGDGEFAPGTRDGPGWLTNPEDSQRLRNYWTKGVGAGKIRWGSPGDFNRCRRQLAKYIKNPQWLAGTCANLHKVAIGVWPGQETGSHGLTAGADAAPAFTLVAAAGADDLVPAPEEWFADPELDRPTPLHVSPDGQVFGHLARWDECHTGSGKMCRVAPHSETGYAYFLTGSYLSAQGSMVPVGTITMNTGHADMGFSSTAAMAHYDNTATAAAYVNVGEDEHGIWVAGTLAPGIDGENIVKLRGAKLSGDWRTIGRGRNLELLGALAVNVPGFPVPHTALAAAGGVQTALVAAGIVEPVAEVSDQERVVTAPEQVAAVVRETLAQVRAEESRRLAAARAMAVLNAERDRARSEKIAAARAVLTN